MGSVYVYDNETYQKGYTLTVGQNMYMDLPRLPIQVYFDVPIEVIDAAFHVHIDEYLRRFEASFIYHREQLTLGSALYTIKANKIIRSHIRLNENREIICFQEVVGDVPITFFCKMLVRAIGIRETQVDIETFLWSEDHEPTNDDLWTAFEGYDLISGCLNRPAIENETWKRLFHKPSAERKSVNDYNSPPQKLLQNRGGRPRKLEDYWAWDEVNVKGRTRREVYPEWLERVKQTKQRVLVDPERTFRHATALKRRRKPEQSAILPVYSEDLDVE